MIVLDLETSGVDTGKCGIWQIGAIELESPENIFIEESRIDDEDQVEMGALVVTGKTEAELRNQEKQSQKQMIMNFLKWAEKCKTKIIIGQNIGWDLNFLQNKCIKYGINREIGETIGSKGFDLYVLAQLKYLEKNGRYRLNERGRGTFSLPQVMEFCGLKNNRRELRGSEIIQEGTPHNALEDCKLEGECFSRIMNGKNLFQEYSELEIPYYLKKQGE